MRTAPLFVIVILFARQLSAQVDPVRFQEEINALKSNRLEPDTGKATLVFTGSSTIRMWKMIREDFPEYHVINRGFGGSHMSDVLFYLEDLIGDYPPDGVILYAGDNDLASGKPAGEIINDFRNIIREVKEMYGDVWICFISAKPSPSRWHLKKEYEMLNSVARIYCEDQPGILFIDTYSSMLGENGRPLPELFLQDSLHMSNEGYQLWKKIITPYLMVVSPAIKN